MITNKQVIEPNIKQRECIEQIENPVMVLAGPGTGKTFTIIQRIKYMIEIGINPVSILCLTYSEAAANEMKARLVKEIGTIAGSVTVNTYHSFCNEIIKQYPQKFELLDGVKLIDDITKQSIMSNVLDEFNPVFYRTKWGDAKYFIPELLKVVDEIKSNRVSKEDYFTTLNTHPLWQGKMNDLQIEYEERERQGKLVKTFLNSYEAHKKKIEKAKEAWEIFEKYDSKLKQKNFIDFNDMINMVLDVFDTDIEFLEKISYQYKYFLVDEYQDTNYSQNRIVFKLAEGAKSRNIFVVGDDDQIIYEFQGAKTDTLEKFLMLYPDTKVICLNENNRSTQNILDFSYQLISQDKSRLEFNTNFNRYNISKKLKAKNLSINKKNSKIQVHGFADLRQENNYIVNSIELLINSDKLPLNKDNEKDLSQIAILCRENNELNNFANLLESKNIKFQIKENKSIFDIKSTLVIYFYLKSIVNNVLHSDKLFGLLLAEPFSFDNNDYNYLLQQHRINHKDLITNIKNTPENHVWANKEKVISFINTYDKLVKIKNSHNIKDLIINVVNETGILNYYIQNDINKSENIYAIKKLIDEAQSYMNLYKGCFLNDFLNHIDSAFESNIPINIDKEEYTQNAVQLITLHGSKGREFEFVYIPNLISKKWEEKKINNSMSLPIDKYTSDKDEKESKKSEQLRLLFVGITRSKHSLFLSYSNSIDSHPQELTSYIAEILKDENIVETFNHELSKDEYLFEIVSSIKKNSFDYTSAFKDELKARLENFILSPSSLNLYLNCPRSFLYSHVLKIPILDKDSGNANYGNAVHSALEWAVKYAKNDLRYPDKNIFINEFLNFLSNEKFDSIEIRENYKQRGIESLSKYYKQLCETPFERIYDTEYLFDYIPFEQNFLKGFIDRIEQNKDGTFELYDYKTGSAKTKSQIADGKTYENYLNQLRFYKLAFEIKNSGSKVTKTGLIFVEESDKNFYINLTDDDNEIIKNKIDYVYENVFNLNFEPPKQEERNCEYCNYRHLCKLNEL